MTIMDYAHTDKNNRTVSEGTQSPAWESSSPKSHKYQTNTNTNTDTTNEPTRFWQSSHTSLDWYTDVVCSFLCRKTKSTEKKVVRDFAILGQSTANVTEEETSGRWIKCIIGTRCVVVSFVFLESGARITSQKSDLLTEVFLFFNIIYQDTEVVSFRQISPQKKVSCIFFT